MVGPKLISSLILGLIVACNITPSSTSDAVPVLLWGGESDSNSGSAAANPLLKTSRAEFDEILNKILRGLQPPFLLFIKSSLCVEDLTQHKEALQQLTVGKSLTYLPAVDSPLSVLESLPFYNQTTEETTDSISDGLMVIKTITDLDSISDTYKMARKSIPNLIAALTGTWCSYSRSERVKRDTKNVPFTINANNGKRNVLMYSGEAPYLKISTMKNEFVQISAPTENLTIVKDQSLILYTTFSVHEMNLPKVTLEFLIDTLSGGYYTLKNIRYNNSTGGGGLLLSTNTEIVFPFNFSYHCSQNIVFSNDSVTLKFTDIQLQVDATSFSDAYDCVGFTTIPIWTGIFVTAILALIMIWALTMIIDIRTMDRFDDPKGKTITISAQE